MASKKQQQQRKANTTGRDARNRDKKKFRRDAAIEADERKLHADARERDDYYKSKRNDAAWYAQNPQLLKDYASFPFGVAIGSKPQAPYGQKAANLAVPGVMALRYSPAVGSELNANSAINIASRNIYSYVRHANSGHSNYDAPDLMMYIVAMDSVYMMHAFMQRLLGVMLDYTPLNRYYPEVLVTAMGCDFADMQKHIVDLRGFINQFAVKMGSMCVPNSMSYMARHSWMTSGLYVDSDSDKAQTYLYTPEFYYQYYFNTELSQGQLMTVQFTRNTTFDMLVTFANSLLDPIIKEEDFNIMSGDILKAFGPEGVVKIAGITEGYYVVPVNSPEVRSQFENSVILGGVFSQIIRENASIGAGYLTDSTTAQMELPYLTAFETTDLYNALTSFPALSKSAPKLVNMHHDGVTPEELVVATRNMFSFDRQTGSSAVEYKPYVDPYYFTTASAAKVPTIKGTLSAVSSDIITTASIYTYKYKTNGQRQLLEYPITSVHALPAMNGLTSSNYTQSGLNSAVQAMALMANFDWHPQLHLFVQQWGANGLNAGSYAFPYFGDVDNYTVLTNDNLQNLADMALLSEFSVPQMGAFSKKV